jgi:hypothetical protein
MKKFPYLIIFLISYNAAISQQKLQDGVYLVDKLMANAYHTNSMNKALITFNASFVEEALEEYSPLLISTDDFVPFEFSLPPIIQKNNGQNKILLLKLTDSASEKLKVFTAKNIKRYVVIVINGEAITVHKIKEPITSGLVQIASPSDNVYKQLYRLLKNKVKA